MGSEGSTEMELLTDTVEELTCRGPQGHPQVR